MAKNLLNKYVWLAEISKHMWNRYKAKKYYVNV